MIAALHAGSVPGMAEGVEVTALREEEFETLLPLIAAYQGFYEVDEIDNDRNRFFFRRFLGARTNRGSGGDRHVFFRRLIATP